MVFDSVTLSADLRDKIDQIDVEISESLRLGSEHRDLLLSELSTCTDHEIQMNALGHLMVDFDHLLTQKMLPHTPVFLDTICISSPEDAEIIFTMCQICDLHMNDDGDGSVGDGVAPINKVTQFTPPL